MWISRFEARLLVNASWHVMECCVSGFEQWPVFLRDPSSSSNDQVWSEVKASRWWQDVLWLHFRAWKEERLSQWTESVYNKKVDSLAIRFQWSIKSVILKTLPFFGLPSEVPWTVECMTSNSAGIETHLITSRGRSKERLKLAWFVNFWFAGKKKLIA